MGRSDSLQDTAPAVVVPLRGVLSAGLLVVLLLLHHETFASMVRSWLENSTYTHGFIIPLIALYFAWERRGEAADGNPRVWWPGFVFVAGLSALWAVATIVSVQVVAQLASVGLISAVVLALAGPGVAAVFALPLLYLLFAVPFGEGIVPLLMEWTADFTVAALHLVGIPVIRDGLYFSIPSGNFEVAEACSGVRYLLASAAAGVAFAFLTYNGWRKRLIFILAALAVPIIANGLRAFGIVLIAHYSDMKLATGIDHFIYGWFFFGVIIFVMFLVGARYADRHPVAESRPIAAAAQNRSDSAEDRSSLILAAFFALALIAAGPALIQYRSVAVPNPELALPSASGSATVWEGPLSPADAWQLGYRGAADELAAAYQGAAEGDRVEVRVAAYGLQSQGAELINAVNHIAAGDGWRLENLGTVATPSDSIPRVRAVRARQGAETWLIWYWYQQGTEATTSNYHAKLLEALAIVDPSPASIVAMGTRDSVGGAEEVLREFFAVTGDALRQCAAGRAGDNVRCVRPDAEAYGPGD
ncbi:exosortase A [Lentisalinibacter salinarum]|uniref:exosortase A n=1 Tax=Lentisalinibacter salinarum TaxID=2992239 RepID=UPI00386B74F8